LSEQAIDYPLALAELTYSSSLIPHKVVREKADFDNRVQEVGERLIPLTVTEVQKDLLATNMVMFQQMYGA